MSKGITFFYILLICFAECQQRIRMSCSLGGDCLFPSETRRGRRIPVATTFRCCDKRFCDFGCLRKHWNGPVTVQGRLCRDGTAQEAAYRACASGNALVCECGTQFGYALYVTLFWLCSVCDVVWLCSVCHVVWLCSVMTSLERCTTIHVISPCRSQCHWE
jgi:hypothetical protein